MSFIGILILFIGLQVFRKSLAGNQNSRDEMQNDTLDDIDNVIAEKLNRMDSILSMQADRNTSDVHMRPRRTPAKDKRPKHDQKDALEDIDTLVAGSLVDFFENPFCQFMFIDVCGAEEEDDSLRKHRHRDRRQVDGDCTREDQRRDHFCRDIRTDQISHDDLNSVLHDNCDTFDVQASPTPTPARQQDHNKHKRRGGAEEEDDSVRKHRHRDRRQDDGDRTRGDRRRDHSFRDDKMDQISQDDLNSVLSLFPTSESHDSL
jgi:hypothetical protein